MCDSSQLTLHVSPDIIAAAGPMMIMMMLIMMMIVFREGEDMCDVSIGSNHHSYYLVDGSVLAFDICIALIVVGVVSMQQLMPPVADVDHTKHSCIIIIE